MSNRRFFENRGEGGCSCFDGCGCGWRPCINNFCCCEDKKKKTKVCNVLTTGPVFRDTSTNSIVSRVYNTNSFPVSVTLELFQLNDDGTETVFFSETKVVQSLTNSFFTTIDVSGASFGPYRAVYTVTNLSGRPVEGVQVYLAGRLDQASTAFVNSHLVAAETFTNSDFTPVCSLRMQEESVNGDDDGDF